MGTAAAIGETVKIRKVRGRNCNVWFGDMHITELTNVDINFILFHFHFLANALDDGANAKAKAKAEADAKSNARATATAMR